MSQSITTKFLPCTNAKPSRIKAECARGFCHYSTDNLREDAHRCAAEKLIESFITQDAKHYHTPIERNPWGRDFVSGQTKNGNYAHVFVN